MNQITQAERKVFEFALDQCGGRETAKILHKEEKIRKIIRGILQKLEVYSMKVAIELYKKVVHSGTPTFSFFNNGTDKARVRSS